MQKPASKKYMRFAICGPFSAIKIEKKICFQKSLTIFVETQKRNLTAIFETSSLYCFLKNVPKVVLRYRDLKFARV